MAVIKPDPDLDEESSQAYFHKQNELLSLKEDEDCPLMKCAVMKFEPELNVGTVKHETCVLSALNEADVDIKHGDLSASPAFCLIKCEREVNTNSINSVPNSNSGIERTVIKEETDPLLITFQDMQGKNEPMNVGEEVEGICSMQTELSSEPCKSHAGHRFQCDICKKFFSKRSTVKRHIRVHTGERPFLCDICKKSFNERSNLKRHIRVHTGERPYSCDICNKCFSVSHQLKVHAHDHTGERPFPCDTCKKSFSTRSNLKMHIRVHTGEQPFACDICKKCFSGLGNLKRHIRVHTEEHPFVCDICEKMFIKRGALEKHYRLHTGEHPFLCHTCGKAFKRQSDVECHNLVHNEQHSFAYGM